MGITTKNTLLRGAFETQQFDEVQDYTAWTLFGANLERGGNVILRSTYAAAVSAEGAEGNTDLLHTDDAWLLTARMQPMAGGQIAIFGVGTATGVIPGTSNPSLWLTHVHTGSGFYVGGYYGGGTAATPARVLSVPLLVGVGMFNLGVGKRLYAFAETEPGSEKMVCVGGYATAVAAALRPKLYLNQVGGVSNITLHRRITA